MHQISAPSACARWTRLRLCFMSAAFAAERILIAGVAGAIVQSSICVIITSCNLEP